MSHFIAVTRCSLTWALELSAHGRSVLWHCSEAERRDREHVEKASYILPNDQEAESEEGTENQIQGIWTFFLPLGPSPMLPTTFQNPLSYEFPGVVEPCEPVVFQGRHCCFGDQLSIHQPLEGISDLDHNIRAHTCQGLSKYFYA